MKKNILITLIAVLVVVVFGYTYKTNKDFAKNISVEKVFETEMNSVEDAKQGNMEGEIKVSGNIDGEKVDVSVFSEGVSKEDVKNKAVQIDLKNIVNADVSTKEFGQKKIEDFKVNLDIKILEDTIYYTVSADLEKLTSAFEDSKEIQSGIQFAGLMVNNKTFSLNLKEYAELLGQPDLLSDMYNVEENKKMVEMVKELYQQDKPFTLSYLNKTESVEGQKAGKFEVVFDFDKTIDFYLNLMQKIDQENQIPQEDLSAFASQIKENKDALLNNTKGNFYVWITENNKVVKTEINSELDLIAMQNDISEITGEGEKLEGDLKLKINFSGTEKKVSSVEVEKPTDAVDIMSLIGGFLPQSQMIMQ